MTDQDQTPAVEIARLTRKLNREVRARVEAERLLEEKSSLLYDTNQRLESEARRAQSLTAAIESATDGVAITDENGLYVFMNQAHASMFGYDVQDMIGQSWTILYEQGELNRFERQIMPGLGATGFWRGETTGKSKTGDYVLQDIALTALANGGLICATRDITARRLAQMSAREMEERLRVAEQEAALFTLGNAVAHDFNNLLGAISGYAMLITKIIPEDNTAHGYAERIGTAAEQAAGVIRSLEVERSNDIETLHELDIKGLFETGLAIAEAIRPPGVLLNIDMPSEAIVLANEVSLSRSLLNVVKNAFEAMGDEGELTINISKEPSLPLVHETSYLAMGEPHSEYDWIVEIKDTGGGIRQDKLERIFDPYYSANTTRKGSGLGLQSLVSLVDSGTAFVEVISQFGHGTIFRLSFPAPGSEVVSKLPPVPVKTDANDHSGTHILVVEDEAMMGEVILETLLHLGYACDLRHDPRQGLELIEDANYRADIVIADMTMPHMSGDQLSERIKQARPDLPIIILSGQGRFIKPDKKYAAILNKPIVADELDRAIKTVLA